MSPCQQLRFFKRQQSVCCSSAGVCPSVPLCLILTPIELILPGSDPDGCASVTTAVVMTRGFDHLVRRLETLVGRNREYNHWLFSTRADLASYFQARRENLLIMKLRQVKSTKKKSLVQDFPDCEGPASPFITSPFRRDIAGEYEANQQKPGISHRASLAYAGSCGSVRLDV